jgi:hypothetical protein
VQTDRERTEVLVIRAWLDDERTQIRARIRTSAGGPDGTVTDATAVGEQEVLAVVADWLQSLIRAR